MRMVLGRALDVKGANWLITPCSGVRPIDLLANGRLSDFECLAGFSEGDEIDAALREKQKYWIHEIAKG